MEALSERAYEASSAVSSRTLRLNRALSIGAYFVLNIMRATVGENFYLKNHDKKDAQMSGLVPYGSMTSLA
jgi:hypothetical protein